MLYPAELRAPWPGRAETEKCRTVSLANQRTGRRSDAFELAERLANKKPFGPGAAERRANPRARSALLRCAVRQRLPEAPRGEAFADDPSEGRA